MSGYVRQDVGRYVRRGKSDRMPKYISEYAADRMPDKARECQDMSENMSTDISDDWQIDR